MFYYLHTHFMKKTITYLFSMIGFFPFFLNAQVPTITSFNPSHGIPGTSVTVNGTNFSTTLSNNVIWLGAIKCNVTSATSTQLIITIPNHASHDFFLYTNTISNLSTQSLKKFLVGFNNDNGYTYGANSFAAATSFTIGSISSFDAAKKFNLSDIDEDGKVDVVAFTGNSTTRAVYYLRNNATPGIVNSSTFSITTATPNVPANTSATYGHTLATDLNSDGRLDYIGSVVGYNGTSFYKNASTTGSPALTFQSTTPTSYTAMPSPFDINKDGKIDILSYYNSSDESYYWENTNTLPANTLSFAFRSVNNSTSIGWTTGREGDLDGDGLVDAVVGGYSSANIRTLRNTTAYDAAVTNFSFAVSANYAISGTRPVDIRIVDLDGDGKNDIITGSSSNTSLNIFPNQSSAGTITLGTRIDIATSAGNNRGIAIGDMNNDGKPDIIVSGSTRLVYLENTSSGVGSFTFASPVLFSATGGADLYSLELADIDGDTRLDIIGCGISGNAIKVFRNSIGDLTKFYSRNSGTSFTSLSDWTSSANGTGGTSPSDFGSDKEFILANRASYTLNGSLNISGKLTLNGNIIDIGNYDLSAGGTDAGSSSSYIATTGSGTFKMNITHTRSVTIPAGNSAYNPVTITNNSGAADVFSTRVLDEVYTNGSSGTTVDYVRVRRTWDIGKTNANAGSGINLIFHWNSGETTTSFNTPAMCHYQGGNWVSQTGATTSNANSLTYTGYTGTFSPFSIMNMNVSLPLQWINLSAALQSSNSVKLNWNTANEVNVKDFDAEWSTDGIKYYQFANIKASNNLFNSYMAVHEGVPNGKIFYRIKQTDIDGKFTYSTVKTVIIYTENEVKIYPNPVDAQLSIYFTGIKTGKALISIVSVSGQEIFTKSISLKDNQNVTIYAGNWTPGLYNIKIINGDGTLLTQKRIIKK